MHSANIGGNRETEFCTRADAVDSRLKPTIADVNRFLQGLAIDKPTAHSRANDFGQAGWDYFDQKK